MEELQDLIEYIRVPDPTREDLATAIRLQAGVRPGGERRTSLARCESNSLLVGPGAGSIKRQAAARSTPTSPFTRDQYFHDTVRAPSSCLAAPMWTESN